MGLLSQGLSFIWSSLCWAFSTTQAPIDSHGQFNIWPCLTFPPITDPSTDLARGCLIPTLNPFRYCLTTTLLNAQITFHWKFYSSHWSWNHVILEEITYLMFGVKLFSVHSGSRKNSVAYFSSEVSNIVGIAEEPRPSPFVPTQLCIATASTHVLTLATTIIHSIAQLETGISICCLKVSVSSWTIHWRIYVSGQWGCERMKGGG